MVCYMVILSGGGLISNPQGRRMHDTGQCVLQHKRLQLDDLTAKTPGLEASVVVRPGFFSKSILTVTPRRSDDIVYHLTCLQCVVLLTVCLCVVRQLRRR